MLIYRGATIARLVGQNVTNQECFDAKVTMWVFEETVNGKKLSDIINQCHENIKYLPGVKLPVNVVCPRLVIGPGINFLVLILVIKIHYRLLGLILSRQSKIQIY